MLSTPPICNSSSSHLVTLQVGACTRRWTGVDIERKRASTQGSLLCIYPQNAIANEGNLQLAPNSVRDLSKHLGGQTGQDYMLRRPGMEGRDGGHVRLWQMPDTTMVTTWKLLGAGMRTVQVPQLSSGGREATGFRAPTSTALAHVWCMFSGVMTQG